MSIWKREPMPGRVTGWSITTPSENGDIELSGWVDVRGDETGLLRYVDAIADGLRRAGFVAEVVITRSADETR